MGYYVAQCPHKHDKEKEKKKHHAHAAEAEDHSKASKDKEFVFLIMVFSYERKKETQAGQQQQTPGLHIRFDILYFCCLRKYCTYNNSLYKFIIFYCYQMFRYT
jgi:hypothetical protein